MKELQLEEIINILNNEPFYLNEEQIETVLLHIQGREDLDTQARTKMSTFIKKLKDFIEDFELLEEKEEEIMEGKVKEKVTKNFNKLVSGF